MKTAFLLMRYYLKGYKQNQFKKFDEQIFALTQMGYRVFWLSIGADGVYLTTNDSTERVHSFHGGGDSLIGRTLEYRALYIAAEKVAKTHAPFDFVYIRSMPVISAYIKALRAIRAVNPAVVMEIPTYNPEKLEEKNGTRLWPKLMRYNMDRNQKKIVECIDLFSLIGVKADHYEGKPAINILNGTSVQLYPKHSPQPKEDGSVHILALANMAYWHGYDRLIRGIADYRQNGGTVPVYLHLVGRDGDGSLQKWETLAKQLQVEQWVQIEGTCYGQKLDDMVNRCDIASASLAFFRVHQPYGFHLKMAEYCSRGIPFICTMPKDDQEFDIPFCLTGIPDDETAVNIEQVVAFAQQARSHSDVAEQMRAYAERTLSWQAQFEKVLIALQSAVKKD